MATWNTEWSPVAGRRGEAIRHRLQAIDPDIVCLTECYQGFLESWGGHVVVGGDDWGYAKAAGKREVLLWSRWAWRDVNINGSAELPGGRFVRAVTDTPFGALTVVGLVIPYHFAHVRHGRRDRKPWQEHCFYLEALAPILKSLKGRALVLGDFNQRIPSSWVPEAAQHRLREAFSDLQIVTAGTAEFNGARAIDHIACDGSLEATAVGTLSNVSDRGSLLSDHFGVNATLRLKQPAPQGGRVCRPSR